jgi:hypothetical protein
LSSDFAERDGQRVRRYIECTGHDPAQSDSAPPVVQHRADDTLGPQTRADSPACRSGRISAPANHSDWRLDMPDLDVTLKEAMQIDGAIGAAIVDSTSGMALGTVGGGKDFDLTIAAAGNSDVVRATIRAQEVLGEHGTIEDILITLGEQYHLIRPLTGRSGRGLFMYLALNKRRANLAMARHQVRQIEQTLDL